jgi:Sec-independent protein secretion pathway component TatC
MQLAGGNLAKVYQWVSIATAISTGSNVDSSIRVSCMRSNAKDDANINSDAPKSYRATREVTHLIIGGTLTFPIVLAAIWLVIKVYLTERPRNQFGSGMVIALGLLLLAVLIASPVILGWLSFIGRSRLSSPRDSAKTKDV